MGARLDMRAKGPGWSDHQRPARIPDDGTEWSGRPDPSESNARSAHRAGGDRDLADDAVGGSESFAAAAIQAPTDDRAADGERPGCAGTGNVAMNRPRPIGRVQLDRGLSIE